MKKVICIGSKIKGFGNYEQNQIDKFIEQGCEVYDLDSFGWIEGKSINELYNNNGSAALKTADIKNNEKIELFKSLRKKRLTQALFINVMAYGEERGVGKGKITTAEKLLDEPLYDNWLDWHRAELTRLDTIDFSTINKEDINLDNKVLFPDMPEFPDNIM